MRRQVATIWPVVMLAVIISSCIDKYNFAGSGSGFVPRIVIQGIITADEGDQQVVVSKSSPPDSPAFSPVSGCTVFIEDEHGNQIPFPESAKPGYYTGRFEGENVIVGSRYRLSVKTPDGKQMQSKFETLMPCPDVDSVYTELQSKPTSDPQITEDGLQFYVNLKAGQGYGNYFRWQLVETYEFHSTWPLDTWLGWDGYHDLVSPDYSHYVCYETDTIGDIFVLSTLGFTANDYNRFKLHFVNDHMQRLQHKYSLLVKQYAITGDAYNYWLNLKKNNQEAMNLFGRQPSNVKGNIYNVNDTTEQALGYFSVSTVRAKRIMLSEVKGLSFSQVFRCHALVISGPLPPDERPLYFVTDYDATGTRYIGLANPECIFCEMNGGTTLKPAYWDQ